MKGLKSLFWVSSNINQWLIVSNLWNQGMTNRQDDCYIPLTHARWRLIKGPDYSILISWMFLTLSEHSQQDSMQNSMLYLVVLYHSYLWSHRVHWYPRITKYSYWYFYLTHLARLGSTVLTTSAYKYIALTHRHIDLQALDVFSTISGRNLGLSMYFLSFLSKESGILSYTNCDNLYYQYVINYKQINLVIVNHLLHESSISKQRFGTSPVWANLE